MTTTEAAPLPTTTGGPTPALVVRGLRKSYGGKAVLDGLDLEVRRGECFALLGPDGAGKTTIIEVLEGVRRRDAGEVAVLGEDPATAGRTWRARIGVVSQGEDAGQALSVRGQRRRLAVALGVQGRPELVVLDEPTTGMDPVARRRPGSVWSCGCSPASASRWCSPSPTRS